MKRRILALLLALGVVFSLLSGCGESAGQTEPPTEKAKATPTERVSAATPEATEPDEEDVFELTLPLVEEEVTLTYWLTWVSAFSQFGLEEPYDMQVYQQMYDRTNVYIDFVTVTNEFATEAFNIMMVGGDMTDFITKFTSYYSAGADSAYNEGYLIDIGEYAKYAPNYTGLLNDNEDYMKNVKTDEGHIIMFYALFDEVYPTAVPTYRADWLNDVGMGVPVTYDDLHDVLTAFKTEKGAEAPLLLKHMGVEDDWINGWDAVSFNYTNDDAFMQIDGQALYSPITDGFKNYVGMMAQWFDEGLIWKDYFADTTTMNQFPDDMTTTDKAGAFFLQFDEQNSLKAKSGNDYYALVTGNRPVQYEGQQLHAGKISEEMRVNNAYGVAISTACDPELIPIAVQWVDYLYSEEGSLLVNYGVEGVSFEYGEDGKPHFSDVVINNPNIPGMIARTLYAFEKREGYYRGTRVFDSYSDENIEALMNLNMTDLAYCYPPSATMTDAEVSRYNEVMSDIHTYVTENINKFIIGQRSMDEWDAYVAEVERLNIQQAIGAKQAALERYNAR